MFESLSALWIGLALLSSLYAVFGKSVPIKKRIVLSILLVLWIAYGVWYFILT